MTATSDVRSPHKETLVSLLAPTAGLSQPPVAWNDTASSYPHAHCIQQLFEAQVERTPFARAVQFGQESLTYDGLNRRANQLAHYLRAQGVTCETPVGISIERSADMMVGLLAILKAGAGYVPVDPAYPRAHRAFMLGDSDANVIVTRRGLASTLPAHTRAVCLDSDLDPIA